MTIIENLVIDLYQSGIKTEKEIFNRTYATLEDRYKKDIVRVLRKMNIRTTTDLHKTISQTLKMLQSGLSPLEYSAYQSLKKREES